MYMEISAPRLSERLFIKELQEFAEGEDLRECIENLVYFGEEEGIPDLPETAVYEDYGKTQEWGVPYIKCLNPECYIYLSEGNDFRVFIGPYQDFSTIVGHCEKHQEADPNPDFIVNQGITSAYKGLLYAAKMGLPKFRQNIRRALADESIPDQELSKFLYQAFLEGKEYPIFEGLRGSLTSVGIHYPQGFSVRGDGILDDIQIPYIELWSEDTSIVFYLYYDGKVLQPFVPVQGNWLHPVLGPLLRYHPQTVRELQNQGLTVPEDFRDLAYTNGLSHPEDDYLPYPMWDACRQDLHDAFSSRSMAMPGHFINPKSLVAQPSEKLYGIMGALARYQEIEFIDRLYQRIKDTLQERNTPESLKRFIGRYYYIGNREFICLKIVALESPDRVEVETVAPLLETDHIYIDKEDRVYWNNIELQEVGEQVWTSFKNHKI